MSISLRNPYSIYYLTAMKTKSFLLCLLLAISANAQIVYHDASAFPLLGKATESNPYTLRTFAGLFTEYLP